MSSINGFLGSKLPNPPAIATTGAWNFLPLFEVTMKLPSSCFSIVSARSPRVKPGSNCLICSIKLSTKSPANTSGNPGISYIGFLGYNSDN